MAKIVVVHGIGQELEGPSTLHARFFPALRDGVGRSGATHLDPDDVSFVSYGQLFRPPAEFLAPQPHYEAADVEPGYEEDLLLAIWERAASCDPDILPPREEVLGRTPRVAARALAALSRSKFLTGVAERSFIGSLKQVARYFRDDNLRSEIQAIVASALSEDTRVVIAHSLGSVAAYEALCASPSPATRSLVTLGSPLGLRNLIFDRLRPAPVADDSSGQLKGAWPSVAMWANIADTGDIVAVVEDLRPLFGSEIRQVRVHNGARAHDMSSYLTDPASGQMIAVGLDA
jgi:hypothetical protein